MTKRLVPLKTLCHMNTLCHQGPSEMIIHPIGNLCLTFWKEIWWSGGWSTFLNQLPQRRNSEPIVTNARLFSRIEHHVSSWKKVEWRRLLRELFQHGLGWHLGAKSIGKALHLTRMGQKQLKTKRDRWQLIASKSLKKMLSVKAGRKKRSADGFHTRFRFFSLKIKWFFTFFSLESGWFFNFFGSDVGLFFTFFSSGIKIGQWWWVRLIRFGCLEIRFRQWWWILLIWCLETQFQKGWFRSQFGWRCLCKCIQRCLHQKISKADASRFKGPAPCNDGELGSVAHRPNQYAAGKNCKALFGDINHLTYKCSNCRRKLHSCMCSLHHAEGGKILWWPAWSAVIRFGAPNLVIKFCKHCGRFFNLDRFSMWITWVFLLKNAIVLLNSPSIAGTNENTLSIRMSSSHLWTFTADCGDLCLLNWSSSLELNVCPCWGKFWNFLSTVLVGAHTKCGLSVSQSLSLALHVKILVSQAFSTSSAVSSSIAGFTLAPPLVDAWAHEPLVAALHAEQMHLTMDWSWLHQSSSNMWTGVVVGS